ncbi:hypothetical protein DV738_g3127, partial [Chaetothyriales sp. CBS 135597]
MADDEDMHSEELDEKQGQDEQKIINEEYKTWKKNAPFLYDMILSTALDWPTLTAQWFPDKQEVPGTNYSKHRLLLGTHTANGVPNYLQIASVQLPNPPRPDVRDYNEQTGEIGGHNPTKKSQIEVKFHIIQKITHPGEVNKARYQPQNPNIIATMCTDGRVLIWDKSKHSSTPTPGQTPEIELIGHEKEGYGLSWSPHLPGHIATASEDTTVRLWDITYASKTNKIVSPSPTYTHHSAIVNDVQYHPFHSSLLGTVSDDMTLQIIDTRSPSTTRSAVKSGEGQHSDAINALAFNPAAETVLATASEDKTIAIWDMRNLQNKLHALEGHNDSVIALEWHPFEESVLGSSSYDRRIIFWDLSRVGEEQSPEDSQDGPPELLFMHGGHTSRISDFSWNMHNPWVVCSAADDNLIQVWKVAEAIIGPDDQDPVECVGGADRLVLPPKQWLGSREAKGAEPVKGGRDCKYAEDFKFQDEGAKLRRRFGKRASTKKDASPTPADLVTPSLSYSLPDSRQSLDGALIPSHPVLGSNPNNPSTPSASEANPGAQVAVDVTNPHYNAFFALLETSQLEFDESKTSSEDDAVATDLLFQRLNHPSVLDQDLEIISLPSEIYSPGLVQEQMLSLFRSSLQPGNQLVPVAKPLRSYEKWLGSLASLTGQNFLLDNAVHPKTGMASETLSATMLLSFYEMFASESNDSWIKHAGGASALMKLHDPSRYRYGLDREIFLACRHAIIIESFYKEVPCFLDQPAWIQVARDIFTDTTKKVTDKDFLELFNLSEEFYEHIVKLPAYLSDLRNVALAYRREEANFSSQEAFLHELMRRVVTSRANLKSYFAKFEGCLMKLNYRWTSYDSDDSLITKYYNFANVFVASSCTGFWNILIILNLMILDIQQQTSQEKESLLELENRECALDICRSTAYMLKSSFLGPFFAIFGLRTSLMCLEDAKEREWVVSKLFEIGQTHMAMAMHIPGYNYGDLLELATDQGKVEEIEQERWITKDEAQV